MYGVCVSVCMVMQVIADSMYFMNTFLTTYVQLWILHTCMCY